MNAQIAIGFSVRTTVWARMALAAGLLFGAGAALAETITLAWTPVTDSRLAGYEVHYGRTSGQYEQHVATTQTSATIAGLQAGAEYFFAVKARAQDPSFDSTFSAEVSTRLPESAPPPAPPPAPAPVAAFRASATQGLAPLTVVFTDESTGTVDQRAWTLGAGASASGEQVVWTYTAPGTYSVTLNVSGPGGSDTLQHTDWITVTGTPPVAAFEATSATRGPAPLTVNFANLSSGAIDTTAWQFGDGGSSAAAAPEYRYTQPGTYSVSLTVSGPHGSDTRTETALITVEAAADLALETGTVEVDHNWRWVSFTQSFADPIVVAGPASARDADPATVRIDGVSPDGFWLRIHEWDYLDGTHAAEQVSYLAMERGVHQLPNGAQVIADRIQANGSDFSRASFAARFTATPIVMSSINSVADPKAAAPRLRSVDATGFQARLDQEEASRTRHGSERLDYIAWEPSRGQVNGLTFAASHAPNGFTERASTLDFGQTLPSASAHFFAHMQTANDQEPATLRWNALTTRGLSLWVAEERSRDGELRHGAESVGWLILY